ncbi:glycoside hydrolase family 2 protein [Asticcacaulis tiandongensis]|uniref:glycoside hydrolase family 2 protein n=1 Tax=Asticcacaulis tiandongensis TaxID=2565365 RepID=UPI0011263F75|nr:glycoside hydrolase family 2 TIM barrel-domain containing protein [Asticcacaulis tiandongensis]
MPKIITAILIKILMVMGLTGMAFAAPQTEKLMLSGNGPDDAVEWDFVISGGMRAGEKAKIAVPSNWQQQGFGHYQYGYDKGPRTADIGLYQRQFTVPAEWKDRTVRIVFDASMTDTRVKVNGVSAGAVHQGGFSRFSYDITKLVKFGEANHLEVEVSEASADTLTDIAERHGDYWMFGGIYRPVWLEAYPLNAITHMAIDAQASGVITADLTLNTRTVTHIVGQVKTRDGQAVGQPFSVKPPAGGIGRLRLSGKIDNPLLWSSETPNLYVLEVTLFDKETALHRVEERIGFRTFEVREGDGLYLNGQRIILKGANRHSFRPDTGRAVTRQQAFDDARTMRDMNMNAVRIAHYSPEKDFLEAADELGLYVIDELTGWQKAHGTEIGRKLVRALIERDGNHPSVIIWANGNEGGWNRELDGDYALYDPQKRPLLHPWDLFGGIDTKHYPRYPDFLRRLSGEHLVLPTEFLHGLYDGGAGSGMDDYWRAIKNSPRGAGGFVWNLADEGIKRLDQDGRIDTYAAYAPDGIMGPHHEKYPSYFTLKDIWSPVQIETPVLDSAFKGVLQVKNDYDFTPLSAVEFDWAWVKFASADGQQKEQVLAQGRFNGPDIAPHAVGQLALPLPAKWAQADALRVVARKGSETLLTWVWANENAASVDKAGRRLGTPAVRQEGDVIALSVGKVTARFDARSGLLQSYSRDGQTVGLSGGPRLVLSRPLAISQTDPTKKAEPEWHEISATSDGVYLFETPRLVNKVLVDLGVAVQDGWNGFRLEITHDGQNWETVYKGARVFGDGLDYVFPPQAIRGLRISELAGVRATPRIASVKVAYEAYRFALPETGAVRVTSGTATDPVTGRPVVWLEAPNAGGLEAVRWVLREDGALTLDYAYSLTGPMLYHGVGFDRPLTDVASVKGLLRGPTPVWQNRQRGPVLGVHEIAGQGLDELPEAQTAGYYANPHWVRLEAGRKGLTIVSEGAKYLQLGARLTDFPTTTVDFPETDIGFMNAIPGMGAKFQAAELTGPQGEPSVAQGQYSGRLIIK